MASPAWSAARRAWRRQWLAAFGTEPTCRICGGAWTLRAGHLHHRTYIRLGAEHFTDILPVCAACHGELHAVLDRYVGWRRYGRAAATDAIIARLRTAHTHTPGDPG